MSWISKVMDPLLGGNNSEARKVADAMSKIGHPASEIADYIVKHPGWLALGPLGVAAGGMLGLGADGKGKGRPGPGRRPPGHPGQHFPTGRNPSANYSPAGEYLGCVEDSEPFTFASRLQFTGAQATATDLGDHMTTAASSDLTANNSFPFNFDVDEATLFISTNSNNAVGAMVETVAVVSSLKFIERKYNAQEQYQFGVIEFAPIYTDQGNVGTPTATAPARASGVLDTNPDSQYVSWNRHYEVNQQWQMVYRTPRAFTPVGLVDLTLNLRGIRN